MRKTGLLRAFITLTVIFGLVAVLLFAIGVIKFPENTGSTNQQAESSNSNALSESSTASSTNSGGSSAQESSNTDAIDVSTTKVSTDSVFYVQTSGITDAQKQIPVYASSAAQVKDILVNEGEFVKAGEPLVVLGGTNDLNHPLAYQLEIALQNYNTAKKGYENAVASTDVAIGNAELQIENARNQTEGFMVDDQVFAANYQGLKDSEGIAADSLIETRIKNERDIQNLRDSISDMEDSLIALESQQSQTDLPFSDQYENIDNELVTEIVKYAESYAQGQVESQITQLKQQIETSKKQLETLQSGAILGENQLMGQVMQVENQEHTLQLNRESARRKMGIDGDTSTSVKIAEQGLKSAIAQSNSALTQASSQLEMARINLESAQDQMDGLIIKAPVNGTVSKMDAKIGALVSPQMAVAEVTNERSYVLKASVNPEDAARIVPGSKAEVLLGNEYVRLPIKSVSSIANPTSKLVTVTIELPGIKFTANQILEVRIPVSPSRGSSTLFVPLDAVTIGSQEQFLFINDNGKAKRVVVELGEISGDLVEIRSGLSGGEEVIIKGAKDVNNGEEINIVNN